MTSPDRRPRPILIEAVCGTCDETFNPLDEDDLEHIQRDDETYCGGVGTIGGAVYSTRSSLDLLSHPDDDPGIDTPGI